MDDVAEIAGKLSPLERDLLCGRCPVWGSWMWTAGSRMVGLGLGTKRSGDIQFDTPLAEAVRAYLKDDADAG